MSTGNGRRAVGPWGTSYADSLSGTAEGLQRVEELRGAYGKRPQTERAGTVSRCWQTVLAAFLKSKHHLWVLKLLYDYLMLQANQLSCFLLTELFGFP